jgi:hypothetical protein
LASTESIAVGLDLGVENGGTAALDGALDFVVGVPSAAAVSGAFSAACASALDMMACAGIYRVSAAPGAEQLGQRFVVRSNEPLVLSAVLGPLPSSSTPDFEVAVQAFGVLRSRFLGGVTIVASAPWALKMAAYAGSYQDDGIGEDVVPNSGPPVLVTFPCPVACETPAPTAAPTSAPTPNPTPAPTAAPTSAPTPSPTRSPTPAPTRSPTPAPTRSPTPAPTRSPTPAPSHSFSDACSYAPSHTGADAPSALTDCGALKQARGPSFFSPLVFRLHCRRARLELH